MPLSSKGSSGAYCLVDADDDVDAVDAVDDDDVDRTSSALVFVMDGGSVLVGYSYAEEVDPSSSDEEEAESEENQARPDHCALAILSVVDVDVAAAVAEAAVDVAKGFLRPMEDAVTRLTRRAHLDSIMVLSDRCKRGALATSF